MAGETIDKRLDTPGWQLNSFDDSRWDLATVPHPPPPPPPPPKPKISLTCPTGERVDFLETDGDNGTCDCDEFLLRGICPTMFQIRLHFEMCCVFLK